MNKQPRAHHFVPRFYLQRFTDNLTADGQLFVTDIVRQKRWITTPQNAAKSNDFYKVELPGLDPMGIEKHLADLEGLFAPILADILTTNTLPKNEGFLILLNFVYLAAARVPTIREVQSELFDQYVKDKLRALFCEPTTLAMIRQMKDEEGNSYSETEIDELRDAVNSGVFRVVVEQNWHIRNLIEAGNVVIPALAERNWAIWHCGESAPDLVCSDNPVTVTSITLQKGVVASHYGDESGLLTMPLSRRALLVSTLSAVPTADFVMNDYEVLMMNTMRATFSRQVYSAQADWQCCINGVTVNASSLINALHMTK